MYYITILLFILLFILIYIICTFIYYKQYHFTQKFHDNLNSFDIQDEINKYERATVSYKQKIPLTIYQTFYKKQLNGDIYQTCMINKTMNFEYNYKFYDNDNVDLFIKEHYPQYLKAYQSLIPGAYKADLFRYLILYKYGGVYIDCKSTTIVPLRDFIPPDANFVMFRDRLKGTLMNCFIACTANHPIIKLTIEKTIDNIVNKKYGINSLDITGPQVIGRAFNIYFGRDELNDIDPMEYDKETTIIGSFTTFGEEMYEALIDINKKPIISRICSNYYNNSKRSNYGKMWDKRNVFYESL